MNEGKSQWETFKEEVKFRWIVINNRFSTLRSSLKTLAIIAFASIFSVEFLLNKIPAYNQFCYDFGQIFLKLCYSYTSAFIFNVLVVHIPKERRKVKLVRLINNKVFSIYDEIGDIISNVFDIEIFSDTREQLTEDQFELACTKFDPRKTMISIKDSSTNFLNWYEYSNYKSKKIKQLINELLLLNDSIDASLIEPLSIIDDLITHRFLFGRKVFRNENLTYLNSYLFRLNNESLNLLDALRSYKKYEIEYHQAYLKKSRKG